MHTYSHAQTRHRHTIYRQMHESMPRAWLISPAPTTLRIQLTFQLNIPSLSLCINITSYHWQWVLSSWKKNNSRKTQDYIVAQQNPSSCLENGIKISRTNASVTHCIMCEYVYWKLQDIQTVACGIWSQTSGRLGRRSACRQLEPAPQCCLPSSGPDISRNNSQSPPHACCLVKLLK